MSHRVAIASIVLTARHGNGEAQVCSAPLAIFRNDTPEQTQLEAGKIERPRTNDEDRQKLTCYDDHDCLSCGSPETTHYLETIE